MSIKNGANSIRSIQFFYFIFYPFYRMERLLQFFTLESEKLITRPERRYKQSAVVDFPSNLLLPKKEKLYFFPPNDKPLTLPRRLNIFKKSTTAPAPREPPRHETITEGSAFPFDIEKLESPDDITSQEGRYAFVTPQVCTAPTA